MLGGRTDHMNRALISSAGFKNNRFIHWGESPVEFTGRALLVDNEGNNLVDNESNDLSSLIQDVSGGGPWTPAQLATAIWWDPKDASTVTKSGSDITQIDDKSGNARHATSTGAIPFTDATGECNIDGTGDYLYNSDDVTLGSEYNWFMVAELVGGENWCRYLSNDPNASDSGAGKSIGLIRNSSSSIVFSEISQTGILNSSTAIIGDSTTHVIDQRIKSGDHERFIDGDSDFTDTSTTGSITDPGTCVGRGSGEGATMKFFELVVVAGSMTVPDREKMQGYLAWRHGLEGQLPAGHPYKSEAPTT